MKIESTERCTKNELWMLWYFLYQEGFHPYPITECQNDCIKYALLGYRKLFFTEIQPEGPWYCGMCKKHLRKNEVVVDHIDHIHNGFGFHNCPENLRALCGSCNTKHLHKPGKLCRRCEAAHTDEANNQRSEAHKKMWAEAPAEFKEARIQSGKIAAQEMSAESRSSGSRKRSRKFWDNASPEDVDDRNSAISAGWGSQSPEKKQEIGEQRSESNRTTWANMTEEQREYRRRASSHGAKHVQHGIIDLDCEFCLRHVRET
jgi:hypothetical protein